MRFEGTIKSWNDDRGFGFVTSSQGGEDIFLHINAFTARTNRPHVGQRVSFSIELGPRGKKRAKDAELMRASRPPIRDSRTRSPAPWSLASACAIPLFALLYAATSVYWNAPTWYAAIYFAASVICFGAYAIDKSAAVAGGWRVPESTLHVLGLGGGWPGAIVAQQLLRHKSSKRDFRVVFWITVLLNIAGFVFLVSPRGTAVFSN